MGVWQEVRHGAGGEAGSLHSSVYETPAHDETPIASWGSTLGRGGEKSSTGTWEKGAGALFADATEEDAACQGLSGRGQDGGSLMLRESTHACEPTHSAHIPSAGGQLGGGCPGGSEDQAGRTRAALRGAGASAETRVALASASAALRVVRQKAVGLTSDDQASVMDKVIHQQRMELQQLRQEKAALEQRSSQQASLRDRGDAAPSCATEKTSVGDSSGVALGRAGDSWDAGAQTVTLDWRGLRVDKVLQRVRSPRKAAAWCAIVVLGVALFVRMQRRIACIMCTLSFDTHTGAEDHDSRGGTQKLARPLSFATSIWSMSAASVTSASVSSSRRMAAFSLSCCASKA